MTSAGKDRGVSLIGGSGDEGGDRGGEDLTVIAGANGTSHHGHGHGGVVDQIVVLLGEIIVLLGVCDAGELRNCKGFGVDTYPDQPERPTR